MIYKYTYKKKVNIMSLLEENFVTMLCDLVAVAPQDFLKWGDGRRSHLQEGTEIIFW